MKKKTKTNSLINLINQQPDLDKIYLYAKDRYEAKYQFLINKRKSKWLKKFNISKALIKYSNNMDDILKKYWRIESKKIEKY